MLTFDELRAAIVMMKRAPLRGEESLAVAQTILKLEAMAKAMLNPAPVHENTDDDKGTPEQSS